MSKMKEKTNNEVTILQDIIDNLNEKNRILAERIECLQDQLDTAYGANEGLLEEQKNDEKYKNLTKLNTLLLVIMGLTQNYCGDSDLGRSVSKAIENFYTDTALSLVKKVDFKFRGKENDEGDYEDNGEEEL